MNFSISPNRKRSLVNLFILLIILFASIIIENPDFPYGICIFRTITGLPCPACGMTHSFVAIGHTRIVDGFKFNIIGPFLYVGVIAGIFLCIIELIYDRLIIQPLLDRFKKQLLFIVIPIVIISWLINIIKYLNLL